MKEYNSIKLELEDLLIKRLKLDESFEYKKFIYNELVNAKLSENFEDDLEEKYRELSNVENIKNNLKKY